MKNIAIFTSGNGAKGAELVRIFNSGERFRVVLAVSDSVETPPAAEYAQSGVECVIRHEGIREEGSAEILDILRNHKVDIILLDGLSGALPESLAAAYPDAVLSLDGCGAMAAARMVMDRFPEDDRYAAERRWADTLGLKFDPSAVTPPPVPHPSPEPPAFPTDETPKPPATARPVRQPVRPAPAPYEKREPMPPTYMLWAILSTLCCCLPGGIIALFFRMSVSSRYYAGDIERARRNSRMTEIWIIASVVLGLIGGALYFPLMLIL